MVVIKRLLMGLGVLFLLFITVGIIATVPISINSRKISPIAEKFAEDYFTKFNNGKFEEIYENLTDSRMRMSQSKEDFVKLLKAIDKKIGKVIKKNKEAVKLQSVPDQGIFFSISYATVHDQGSAVENFTIRKNDDKWLLVEYGIMSKELILK